MFAANALVGLREGLEAALVVVILVAFLVKSGRTWALKYVWLGVATAVVLSILLGGFLTFGTQGLDEKTSETIGGVASLIAVAFVTVMVFWMKGAARTISGELKGKLDRALELGPLAIALVGFIAVGREGLETAIFFYATAQSAGAGEVVPLLGWAVGIGAAIVLGVLIYKGALRIDLAKFFKWTGAFLVIVAGGILAYAIHELQEAGVLPGEDALAFDIRSVLAKDSGLATLLRGIFNFRPAMSVLEVGAWLAYVGTVLTLFLRAPRDVATVAPRAEGESVRDRSTIDA